MRGKAGARTPSLKDADMSLKLEPAVYGRSSPGCSGHFPQSSRRICFQGDPR